MRYSDLLLLASAILSIGAAQEQAPITVIAIRHGENHSLNVAARINDVETPCSIDSGGGNRIYVGRDMAARAGIQPKGTGRSANPQSNTFSAHQQANANLTLGSLTLENREVLIQARPNCVIGLSTLADYVVSLSYEPPELRVHAADGFDQAKAGFRVPFVLKDGTPFVDVSIALSGGDRVTASLAVDTGGGRPAAYLSKSFVEKHDILDRVGKAVPDFWSGEEQGRPRVLATRLPSLRAGEAEHKGPILFLWQTRGFGGATEPDGLLCPDFLRRYTLVFDFPGRTLFLKPGALLSEPTPFDASGALIYREGANPYRVLKMIDGSPVAEAGLRQGDVVMEINGRKASEMSQTEVTSALQADGAECVVVANRGGQSLSLRIKLRGLI